MGIPLTEKARILLLSNKERLSRDFMAEHIVSYLVQMSAITPADMSDILDEVRLGIPPVIWLNR